MLPCGDTSGCAASFVIRPLSSAIRRDMLATIAVSAEAA